jgi:hypothetical protein
MNTQHQEMLRQWLVALARTRAREAEGNARDLEQQIRMHQHNPAAVAALVEQAVRMAIQIQLAAMSLDKPSHLWRWLLLGLTAGFLAGRLSTTWLPLTQTDLQGGFNPDH